ncbi:MAG: FHIPEP family type III secretion protein [Woeseiaceae bacterium]
MLRQSFQGTRDWRRSGYSDLILAGGVLLIMALMVLRLPTPLIDALVAVNITLGVCLLLLAIYIPSPVMFNSFPSVLLISTLFRLALTVATTRLILLEADAGSIIQAFGTFVAGGNLVVGVVVFLIITIVQFIVIAKGAERVAEVSARFTLDAMPGKQLSIDSDLRSGLIEKDEAKRRRKTLEAESQLNGALDGAMKFVKGDAIASIVIVVVNLAGGLTVGIAQHGLGFGEALETYSILTIGDGMVAQIPALLGAMAAGLVVTRTTSDDDRHLGNTIGRQIVAQPRALLLTGAMALLLAMTPGFPALIFVAIALLLFLSSGVLAGLQPGRNKEQNGPASVLPVSDNLTPVSIATPLLVELPAALCEELGFEGATACIERARRDVIGLYGVPLPSPEVRIVDELNDTRVQIFDTVAELASDGEQDGADRAEYLTKRIRSVLVKRARDFIGIQEVTQLLELATAQYPALVREVSRYVSNQQVAEVLRNLVDERIAVRNLRSILESLAEFGEREKNPAELSEIVRIGLKHQITRACLQDDATLKGIAMTPEAEAVVRAGLQSTPAGIVLSLNGSVLASLRDAIGTAVAEAAQGHASILLLSADIRRHVRHLIAATLPTLRIVSYAELLPDVQIDLKARVVMPQVT